MREGKPRAVGGEAAEEQCATIAEPSRAFSTAARLRLRAAVGRAGPSAAGCPGGCRRRPVSSRSSAMLALCWAVVGCRPLWKPILLLSPVPLPAGGRPVPFSTTCVRCSKNRRLRQKRIISERKLVSREGNQLLICSACTGRGSKTPYIALKLRDCFVSHR